jgi:hypothetical protein
MEFFHGFKWAVPTAFSDAVGLCRFEEGDLLYDSPDAYTKDWPYFQNLTGKAIQVRGPARSRSRTTDTGGVFETNWYGEVIVDLFEPDKLPIRSTQGRLYTALWRGNMDFLRADAPHPEIPITVASFGRKLRDISEHIPNTSDHGLTFVMARDKSNAVSRDKFLKIRDAFRGGLASEPVIQSPADLKVPEAEKFSPTVEIVLFRTSNLTRVEIEALVKMAVYKQAKGASRDMFRLSAHGAIV